MNEPTLFDLECDFYLRRGVVHRVEDVHGLARYGDPDTSITAAQHITGRTEREILRIFTEGTSRWASFALTDDELCEWVKAYPPTVKSARSRLSNKRLLVDSGARHKSARGVDQIVWKLGSPAAPDDPVPEQE